MLDLSIAQFPTPLPLPSSSQRKLAVVGKGLTFDAGGYNIKTAMMELMKFDMGGR